MVKGHDRRLFFIDAPSFARAEVAEMVGPIGFPLIIAMNVFEGDVVDRVALRIPIEEDPVFA